MSESAQLNIIDHVRSLMEGVKEKLAAGDDPKFWETAFAVLVDDFLQKFRREATNRIWIFQVGACSHWVRPHQSLWNAAGGFAYPEGYANSLPEFDWSVIFGYENPLWIPLRKLPRKKCVIFRVAVPARTAKHKQGAVHAKWSTCQNPVFYGFRKINGRWKCVAASDE
jgi:hypothetical protein